MIGLTASAATPSLEVGALNGAAAARSRVYQTFSYLFSYPTSELVTDRYGTSAAEQVSMAMAALPYALDDEASELVDLLTSYAGRSDLLAERYTALFDNCTGRARVSLREANHVRQEPRYLWEELVRFYEHFGLDYNLDRTKVWPDHLTVQTDLMHYLTFLEAGGADQDVLVRAERDFLSRHLAKWTVDFAASFALDAEAGTPVEPFAAFARLLVAFARADLDYLNQR